MPATTRHNVLKPLETLLVDINELVPDPANARLHNERNLTSIKNSLTTFGQHQPIVVQKQGMIVRIGNGRVSAAKELGWTHMAAIVVDEDNVSAAARAIADNKSADLAEWDFPVLSQILTELKNEDVDLINVGFEDYEVEPLIATDWFPEEKETDDEDETSDFSYKQARKVDFSPEEWEQFTTAFESREDKEMNAARFVISLLS